MSHISTRRSHCTARPSLNKDPQGPSDDEDRTAPFKGHTDDPDDPMVPFHRVIRWDRESIGRRFASPSRLALLSL